MKKIFFLVISVLILNGCSINSQGQSQNTSVNANKFTISIVGHWRNDKEKTDYIFYKDNKILSILREKSSSDCTYEINKQNDEKKYLEVWFKCPQTDWPGYVEQHTFEFSDEEKFVDTMYIQGMASRVDGEFDKVGNAGE
jgi:hypothetical protein